MKFCLKHVSVSNGFALETIRNRGQVGAFMPGKVRKRPSERRLSALCRRHRKSRCDRFTGLIVPRFPTVSSIDSLPIIAEKKRFAYYKMKRLCCKTGYSWSKGDEWDQREKVHCVFWRLPPSGLSGSASPPVLDLVGMFQIRPKFGYGKAADFENLRLVQKRGESHQGGTTPLFCL